MRISVGMIALNEVKWIRYALNSVYDFADEVIVVDGGSDDGTPDLVEDYFSEKARVISHPVRPLTTGGNILNDQRNIYLKEATGDIIMYCDTDEAFKLEDLMYAKRTMKDEKIGYVMVKSYHFWHDFWHIATGGGWDTSYLMLRFIRNEPGLHMHPYKPQLGDHTLLLKDDTRFAKHRQGILLPDDYRCYHYGHAKGREDKERKIKFFLSYDYPEVPQEEYEEKVKNDSWFDSRWFEGINCDPEHVKPFTGSHPEAMKSHPRYSQVVIKDDIKQSSFGE